MKKIKVSVKAKVGSIEKTETYDYNEPDNLAEAIEVDTESKVFKTYLNKRKTNFQDEKRKDLVEALTNAILAKMKELGITL